MSRSSKTIEELSRELAAISGLILRPAKPGEERYSPAGQLRARMPEEFFHWRKCPIHNTWLQPVNEPFKHWACQSYSIDKTSTGVDFKVTCTFKRPAKLRTRTEHKIFAVMKFLELKEL